MNLLARREHSRGELRAKLCRRFDDATLVEDELQRLADENLQSDARYAESFVRQRVSRGQGPFRIRGEMRQRGLDEAVIAAAIEGADVDWSGLAESVSRRKFGQGPPPDRKSRAQRERFLQYRGFAAEHYRYLDSD